MSWHNDILYDNAEYHLAPGLDIEDFKIQENWYNRPASKWSVRRIGYLQFRIEQYAYAIYYNNTLTRNNIFNLIPSRILIQLANKCFGYDGWCSEVVDVKTVVYLDQETPENVKTNNFTVSAEVLIKLTLKDGTYTKSGGEGTAISQSKGEAYSKSKKIATSVALKKCILSFESIIIDHEEKLKNNFYVDGLYGSKAKGNLH